jgi:hypothetical protein
MHKSPRRDFSATVVDERQVSVRRNTTTGRAMVNHLLGANSEVSGCEAEHPASTEAL